MTFELSPERLQWRDAVRQFVEQRLQPHDAAIEESCVLPAEARQAMADFGLFGTHTPAGHGGLGRDMLDAALATEQLARAHIAYYYTAGVNVHIGSKAIELAGSEDQRRRWLPDLASGRQIAAFALTEPGAGSDAASVATRARRDGDAYVLDGEKRYITNAPIAGVFTVFAATDPERGGRGLSAFVVEAGTPGLEIGAPTEMCGGRGSFHAPLRFEGCRVPAANRVGEEGQGFPIAMQCLDAGRTHWAAYAVGAAERLLELAVAHLRSRRQFGRPLADNQGLQWMLAELAAELHAARLVCYEAALAYDRAPDRRRASAARAKLYCTGIAGRVADGVMQMFGGAGYARELPIERIWREVRVARILDGTSEILKTVLARDLLA